MIFLPAPAIIEAEPFYYVRLGVSVGPSRVEYQTIRLPKGIKEATPEDVRFYVPSELKDVPDWSLRHGMLPAIGFPLVSTPKKIKTTTYLISTSASNQSWSVINDWNDLDNVVHCIGGGGGGGATNDSTGDYASGGGGGAYARSTNINLTGGGSATFRLHEAAAGAVGRSVNGVTGGDTWFNGTTLAGSSVGAKGGTGGYREDIDEVSPGGLASASVGSVRYNGGYGDVGDESGTVWYGGGGGGAAGPNGAGGNGNESTGGQGGNGSGGAGGTSLGTRNGSAGGEFNPTFPARGSGGGGGGGYGYYESSPLIGGHGGNYGGGGGAGGGYGTSTAGNGAQGLIVVINNVSL